MQIISTIMDLHPSHWKKKGSLDLWPAIQNQYQILPYIEHVDFGILSLGEEVWQTVFKNRWVCVSLRHMLLFTQGVREGSEGGEVWPIWEGKGKWENWNKFSQ